MLVEYRRPTEVPPVPRELLPEQPIARLLAIERGGRVLRAEGRCRRHRAVGDEHEVVVTHLDRFLRIRVPPRLLRFYALRAESADADEDQVVL